MNKKTIEDINVKGKRVLVRCDFNVPLNEKGKITNDNRIVAALPTIKYLMEHGARVILCSHLGRPKGEFKPEFSLKPVAARLSELLGREVPLAEDVVGPSAHALAEKLQDGDVMMIENVRFHAEETKNDPEFSKQLASLAEIYVNDAFGTAHRAHSSTEGVAHYLPAVAGFLIGKEISIMGDALENPERPFLAIIGGSKVSDKIGVINNLLNKVDVLIIGGGMAYTFKKAQGIKIGNSLCEDDQVAYCKEMLAAAAAKGIKILLPVDNVIANKFPETKDASDIEMKTVEGDIPDGWMGLDIGPKSVALFADALRDAKTVVWNGPMGCFEFAPLSKGTYGVCDAVATVKANGGVSIIGGGDSVSAVKKSGKAAEMSHVSTGGGASLEFLEGKTLPGVAALTAKK